MSYFVILINLLSSFKLLLLLLKRPMAIFASADDAAAAFCLWMNWRLILTEWPSVRDAGVYVSRRAAPYYKRVFVFARNFF